MKKTPEQRIQEALDYIQKMMGQSYAKNEDGTDNEK